MYPLTFIKCKSTCQQHHSYCRVWTQCSKSILFCLDEALGKRMFQNLTESPKCTNLVCQVLVVCNYVVMPQCWFGQWKQRTTMLESNSAAPQHLHPWIPIFWEVSSKQQGAHVRILTITASNRKSNKPLMSPVSTNGRMKNQFSCRCKMEHCSEVEMKKP